MRSAVPSAAHVPPADKSNGSGADLERFCVFESSISRATIT